MRPLPSIGQSRAAVRAMTLVELLMSLGIASLVLAFVSMLFLSSLFSFAGMGNYASLTGQSRQTLDQLSMEIRNATGVLGADTNLPLKWLLLTNSFEGKTIRFSWNAATKVLTSEESGSPLWTNLVDCQDWQFSFYQRTPSSSWRFYPTTNLALCKLINMSWTCSRSLVDRRVNSEDMVTAQIVLRNKH